MIALLVVLVIVWAIVGILAGTSALSYNKFPPYWQKPVRPGVHWTRAIDMKKAVKFSLACGPGWWFILGCAWLKNKLEDMLED